MLRIKKVNRYHFDKIVVPAEFKLTQPSPQKIIKKTADFFTSGHFGKIYVDKEFRLLDGYCSYLIAEELGCDVIGKKLKICMISDVRVWKNEMRSDK